MSLTSSGSISGKIRWSRVCLDVRLRREPLSFSKNLKDFHVLLISLMFFIDHVPVTTSVSDAVSLSGYRGELLVFAVRLPVHERETTRFSSFFQFSDQTFRMKKNRTINFGWFTKHFILDSNVWQRYYEFSNLTISNLTNLTTRFNFRIKVSVFRDIF